MLCNRPIPAYPESLDRKGSSFAEKRIRVLPLSDANVQSHAITPVTSIPPVVKPASKDHSPETTDAPRFVHVQYLQCFNLAFERVCKYTIFQVLDRGVYPRDWTSYRMRWQTLYFEDASDRYELKRYTPSDKGYVPNRNYCLSVVKQQFIFDRQRMKKEKIPFDASRTIVLEDHISWKDIVWGLERVRIHDRLISLRYLVFYPNSRCCIRLFGYMLWENGI